MRHVGFCTLWVVVLACLSVSAAGQETGTVSRDAALLRAVLSRDAAGVPTIRAFRVTEAFRVDGVLDEELYGEVEPASDLVQQDPDPGAPSTERTDVWVFFDDSTLYVSARLWYSRPEREQSHDSRRDAPLFRGVGDSFTVGLDTFLDRRNGYQFGVTPRGGLYDSLSTNERDVNRDWNGIWNAKTAQFEQGWTVEIAIPFKTLRYASSGAQTWGFNVVRVIKWKNELAYLTAIPPSLGAGGGLLKFSSAATLVGLELPPAKRVFEVKPYAISETTTDRTASPPTSNAWDGAVGIDAKLGLSSSLTADLTYNTDFAQVEADEQQINLTRFSLFFPEKREFFLEGQGIFTFGGYAQRGPSVPGDLPLLFFSRRIGLENGRAVPIIGGARLTGRAGPFSLGLLNIQTDDEPAAAARATNFSVFRVKRDLLRRSSVGALVTTRSRSTRGDGVEAAYGVDAVFSFFENLNVNAYLARTNTPGLSGDDMSYRGQVDYNGDRYGLQVERLTVDRNFHPGVGYSRRQDFRRNLLVLRFSPRPASLPGVRKFVYEGGFDHYVNSAGRLETRQVRGTFRTEFSNSDMFAAEVTDNYEYVPLDFPVFAGVIIPVGGYRFQNARLEYGAGSQRRVAGTISYDYGGFYDGTKSTLAYSSGRAKVGRDLVLEPTVSLNWIDLPQHRLLAKVVTLRTVYPLNPRTLASALVQYNSTTQSLSVNARLRWEYQAGSEFFIVYSDGRTTNARGFPELESRSFVVKVTRFLRH